MKPLLLSLSLALSAILLTPQPTTAQPSGSPDPNFFIYLCIGQSNMGSGSRPEEVDLGSPEPRLLYLATAENPRSNREVGKWYEATYSQDERLGLSEFFGRTMVKNLPKDIKVGIINVSVAGAKVEVFDKENYKSYLDTVATWMQDICKSYGGNPYQRLIDMARLAQKEGVIQGIVFHQGESNSDDPQWPEKMKSLYHNIVNDLNLDPMRCFLLAGELKYKDQNGVCYPFNTEILPNLPKVLPNSYIISADGVKGSPDPWHFVTSGYREFGKRYAIKALEIQGFPYAGEPASNL